MTTRTTTIQLQGTQRLVAGVVALAIGLGIVFMVGLSPMAVAHNTAHDTRHAIGFPCH